MIVNFWAVYVSAASFLAALATVVVGFFLPATCPPDVRISSRDKATLFALLFATLGFVFVMVAKGFHHG